MRNFSLREKQSVITVLREPPKKQKKFPWQKWSFIAIIIVILAITIFRALSNLWIIHANGQIEVKKQTVHFAEDIKLQKFFVEEGQKIKAGDTLFRYKAYLGESVSTSITDYDRPEDWIEKQKIDLSSKIAQKSFEIEELMGRIATTNSLANMKKEMILLGSVNDKNEYEYLRLDVKRLELSHTSAQKELKYLKNLRASLLNRETNIQRVTTTNKSYGDDNNYFVAPMAGIIGQINFNANETCFRRDEVLTIHELEDMKIKVYFDPYEMKYLNAGDEVNVTFPDGSTSTGFIDNFHVATYALPEEFQKKYEPTTRNIVANVELLDDNDSYKLMHFYKMNVRISKSRFNFSI